MYKQVLVFNNLLRLIYHKTQPTIKIKVMINFWIMLDQTIIHISFFGDFESSHKLIF